LPSISMANGIFLTAWVQSMENMLYYSAQQMVETIFSTIKGHLVLFYLAAVDAIYLSMHTPACKGKHVMVVYFYIAHFIMHS